jgi:hypothetical protein
LHNSFTCTPRDRHVLVSPGGRRTALRQLPDLAALRRPYGLLLLTKAALFAAVTAVVSSVLSRRGWLGRGALSTARYGARMIARRTSASRA